MGENNNLYHTQKGKVQHKGKMCNGRKLQPHFLTVGSWNQVIICSLHINYQYDFSFLPWICI
jgi:hypothetical protein